MRERGFTLMEMIAVLFLVGVVLAMSPLALDSLIPERELAKEQSRLGTTVDLLHTQAALERTRYAMHIDTEEHRWAIQAPTLVTEAAVRDGEESVEKLVLDDTLDPEELDWHSLPSGMTLEFYEGSKRRRGRYMIIYRPDGTVDPHTIVLESNNISSLNENDRMRTVKVNFPGFVSYALGRATQEFKLSEAELGR